jgi:hypothetical protein
MKVYTAIIEKGLMALTIGLYMASCIDPFEPEAVDFNSAIVIEATITDENKYQEILISRTFALDTTGIYGEGGAKVAVTDTNGTVYDFEEKEEGKYVSNSSFAAQAGLGYSLPVTTADGNLYSSDAFVTPNPTKIDNLYAKRGFKDDGINEGMFIYIDNFDPIGDNKYYRYGYEETHKIIAPFWTNKETYLTDEGLVDVRLREKEEEVCYNTSYSTNLIIASTVQFSENRISKFPVRFIDRNDYILSHRYSILVRQYVQSLQAFNYYEDLKKLSGSESLFSQVQTGFLEGNIISVNNRQELVIGYFEISSISEKRIFFNYTDFFEGEELPPFVIECPYLSNVAALVTDIERDATTYWDENNGQYGAFLKPAPWIFVDSQC